MYQAYTYLEPYHSPSAYSSDVFYIVLVLALIIVAIVWVLGGFDSPDFPKRSIERQIKRIFNEEVRRAAFDGNAVAALYLQKAEIEVLRLLEEEGVTHDRCRDRDRFRWKRS